MADRDYVNELYDNHGGIVLTGSADAYVATISRPVGGYHQQLRLCAQANHTNTGAATLNLITSNAPSGLGAVAIRKAGNAALTGGELVSGHYYDFIYDASNAVFQVFSPNLANGTIRERLTANRTYYVRTDGSDSNTGLANTSGGAFLTMQRAYDVIVTTLDLAGFSVTIQVADGTYTTGIDASLPLTGGSALLLRGNVGTPANVILSVTSLNGVACLVPGLNINVGGMEFRTTTAGSCLVAGYGGIITIGAACRFGVCVSGHIVSTIGGIVDITADYTISGNAAVHWNAFSPSEIRCIGRTITLSGTPAFSSAFATCSQAGLYVFSNTFSGAATGVRYDVNLNGVIYTAAAGATYLPGNAAGVAASGGQYV
jgi:hypothetical protein